MRNIPFWIVWAALAAGCVQAPSTGERYGPPDDARFQGGGASADGYLPVLVTEEAPGDNVFGLIWSKDGTPARNAQIGTIGREAGTVADNRGWFSFKRPAGATSLLVEMIGHASRKVPIPGKGGAFLSVPLETIQVCRRFEPDEQEERRAEVVAQAFDALTGEALRVPIQMEGRITDGSGETLRARSPSPIRVQVPHSGYYDFSFSTKGYGPWKVAGVFAGPTYCEPWSRREITAWMVPVGID